MNTTSGTTVDLPRTRSMFRVKSQVKDSGKDRCGPVFFTPSLMCVPQMTLYENPSSDIPSFSSSLPVFFNLTLRQHCLRSPLRLEYSPDFDLQGKSEYGLTPFTPFRNLEVQLVGKQHLVGTPPMCWNPHCRGKRIPLLEQVYSCDRR